MKKLNYILFSVVAMFASCVENDAIQQSAETRKGAIEFAYALPSNSTRTVITASTGFPVGGAMAVEGLQTNEKGEISHIFTNDRVWLTDDGVNWTYDIPRYWDISSTYMFYAMYPYEANHSFNYDTHNYTISNFVVANKKEDQKDVMIAEEKSAMPENKVTFTFNHLLSQVNFFFKASPKFDLTGIASIELTGFDLIGAKNTGSYQQTGFNATNNNVVGSWTVADQGEYDMAVIKTAPLVTSDNPVSSIESGLLMMPQNLKGVKAQVSYRIHYESGATASYSSEVSMAKALITNKKSTDGDADKYVSVWRPNYVYNYNFGVNPSKRNIDDYDIDVDGSENGDGTPSDGDSIVIDDEGNWWVDEDGDGIGDVPIVWEDIDGDGREEGGVDRDGDGHIDNSDGENENPDDNDLVTDGDEENNPDGKDVILVDTDGDGVCDTQLERDGDTYYPDPERDMNIEFSADVEGFQNEVTAEAE